jgi:MOSC domain-containing protein YiiM
MIKISPEEKPFLALFGNFVQSGKVTWIGVRISSKEPMHVLDETYAEIGGLLNDRSNKGNADSKRQVTLIQYEHLQSVASFLGKDSISPTLARRNIVVQGINLNALKGKQFKLGDAVLEMTDFCYPCSRMEERLGKGGFNAMRGHGGITCKVIQEGMIRVGDEATPC